MFKLYMYETITDIYFWLKSIIIRKKLSFALHIVICMYVESTMVMSIELAHMYMHNPDSVGHVHSTPIIL